MRLARSFALILLTGTLLIPALLPAQTPTIRVYFDEDWLVRSRHCPDETEGTVLDTLYVVATDFGNILDLEYSIEGPLLFLADLLPEGYSASGVSFGGIIVTFPGPVPFTSERLVHRVWFAWGCTGCQPWSIFVQPHPASGKIQGTRWPDLVKVEGVGSSNLLCYLTVPTESETWGGVKALYR